MRKPDYKSPYETDRTARLRYQITHFPAAVLEKGGLLSEQEITGKLLEEYKDEIEMQDNIGGG